MRLLFGALCFILTATSCIDDKIDLSNVSSQMQIGDVVAIPIGNAYFDMSSLLAENGAHMNSSYKLETIDGVVALTYDTLFTIPNMKLMDGNKKDTLWGVDYSFYEDLPEGIIIKPADPHIVITSKNSARANIDLILNKVTGSTGAFVEYDNLTVIPENEEVVETITNQGKPSSTSTLGRLIGDKNVTGYKLSFSYQAKPGKSNFSLAEALNNTDFLKLNVKFIMPLWFEEGCHFTYTDTIKDMRINDILDNEFVKKATIRFVATNSFPFGGKVKFKMLDQNFNPIGTFKNYVYDLASAKTDGNGRVVSSVNDTIWLHYDEDMIDDLKRTKHMVITVSTDPEPMPNKVRISEDNNITFKGGIYTEGIHF
ncbi:MAG: hypothetical protein J6W49_01640 [Paludibacteraceae bacterium]|nr:hypothetical protein [Paludibacteraceae bacterium]